MNFEPINWKAYNKPPYLPQWLSVGETKKFVSFDDDKLIEIEGQIYDLSNQFDIEEAKGILLDRIGKIVAEPRNGNDDELYRLLIKLRILLNNTNGSVNDIIKVIKFLYSSSVIEIGPKYPAALLIVHDGHQEYIDYNRILRQVIGAGIGYETRELFGFVDEVIIEEVFKITDAEIRLVDSFADTDARFDGTYTHDGEIVAGGGIEDKLVIDVRPKGFLEKVERDQAHDGTIDADGTCDFDGKGPIGDYLSVNTNIALKDKVEITDELKADAKMGMADHFPTAWLFDGSLAHDGEITADASDEKIVIESDGPNAIEEIKREMTHDGSVMADGENNFDGVATGIGEIFSISMTYSHTHDGATLADGSRDFNSGIEIPA